MHGRLARGEFVKLAYRLGLGAATGELEIAETEGLGGSSARTTSSRHRVYLRRGYLTAARVEGHWAPLGQILRDAGAIDDAQLRRSLEAVATGATFQGRALVQQGAVSEAHLDAALRRQAELRLERLAAIPSAEYRFDAHAHAPPAHLGGRPVALTTWARRHLESKLDAARARSLAAELHGVRVSLKKNLCPPPSLLDDTDRRIVAALAAPRRLDELEQASRAPRLRLLAFLFFLRSIGAVELLGVAADCSAAAAGTPRAPFPKAPPRTEQVPPPRPPPRATSPGGHDARRLLGVDVGADAETIRRAYRRLARALHPDRHPEASTVARKSLELRFAEVTQAYRELVR